MQEVTKLISMVKEIWNVEVYEKQMENILKLHPNIIREYNTQKSIFGINMFDSNGHKSIKKLGGYE